MLSTLDQLIPHAAAPAATAYGDKRREVAASTAAAVTANADKNLEIEGPCGLPFTAALFDFDGTLAATHDIWHHVDVTFLNRRGIPYTPSLGAQLAALGFEQGAHYMITTYGLDETVEAICDEWNALARDLYREEVCLREGAAAYIKRLRAAGIKTALVTTNDAEVLHALDDRLGLHALFDIEVYGGQVGASKEEPTLYLEAARLLEVAPEACVVFEDIPQGMASAQRAGMATVGLTSDDPHQDREAMRAHANLMLEDWIQLA
jgi:HAD superfamily hydrolase (TIGR01509 family)